MAFAELGDNRRAWELFDLINPVNHANSATGVATYKAEPYVVAADVYAVDEDKETLCATLLGTARNLAPGRT